MTRDELLPCCKAEVVLRYDLTPLQLGMDRHPYYVAVASMLMCRTRRLQAEPVLRELLRRWPVPSFLAASDTAELEQVVRPCGLHRNRSRMMQRFANRWLSAWTVFEELPGCGGTYIADAVRLFCLNDVLLHGTDGVLHEYARKVAGQTHVDHAQGEGGWADSVLHGGDVR